MKLAELLTNNTFLYVTDHTMDYRLRIISRCAKKMSLCAKSNIRQGENMEKRRLTSIL